MYINQKFLLKCYSYKYLIVNTTPIDNTVWVVSKGVDDVLKIFNVIIVSSTPFWHWH